jgi:Concanavalin A-like lectin/glucanases superfamily
MIRGVIAAARGIVGDASPDPFWDDTHLLLNFNDALGSTTFVDDSQYGNSVVRASGTPTVVENAAMFDGKCLKGGNHPSIVNATLSNSEAPSAYTVECYVIPIDGQQCGIFWTTNLSLSITETNAIQLSVSGYPRFGVTLTPGIRYHIAMTAEGDKFTVYVDGVQIGTHVSSSPHPLTANHIVRIGRTTDSGFSYLNGYIDKYRLTLAIRYTAPFTPVEY